MLIRKFFVSINQNAEIVRNLTDSLWVRSTGKSAKFSDGVSHLEGGSCLLGVANLAGRGGQLTARGRHLAGRVGTVDR